MDEAGPRGAASRVLGAGGSGARSASLALPTFWDLPPRTPPRLPARTWPHRTPSARSGRSPRGAGTGPGSLWARSTRGRPWPLRRACPNLRPWCESPGPPHGARVTSEFPRPAPPPPSELPRTDASGGEEGVCPGGVPRPGSTPHPLPPDGLGPRSRVPALLSQTRESLPHRPSTAGLEGGPGQKAGWPGGGRGQGPFPGHCGAVVGPGWGQAREGSCRASLMTAPEAAGQRLFAVPRGRDRIWPGEPLAWPGAEGLPAAASQEPSALPVHPGEGSHQGCGPGDAPGSSCPPCCLRLCPQLPSRWVDSAVDEAEKGAASLGGRAPRRKQRRSDPPAGPRPEALAAEGGQDPAHCPAGCTPAPPPP